MNLDQCVEVACVVSDCVCVCIVVWSVVFACEQGDTPLHSGAIHGHADVVRVLLEHGANVYATDSIVCVVLYACWAPAAMVSMARPSCERSTGSSWWMLCV